jgi:transposase-like protein
VKRKRYSRKFQRMAVARRETCEDVGELARELGVRLRCLYKWRRKLEMVEPGQEASRPSTHASAHRKEIHRLKQLLAEKTIRDFSMVPCKKSRLDASSTAALAK